MNITVVTWNVLADCYSFGLEKDKGYSRSHHLSWSRWSLIKDQLLRSGADIVCLQEVDHYDECYLPLFSECGFQVLHLKRRDKEDGCLIAYKSFLRVVRVLEVQLDDIAYSHPLAVREKYLRRNCAILLKLEFILSPAVKFWISNCHLFWNPFYPDVKLEQLCYLLHIIENSREIGEPVVIAGDFNSLPTSEVYKVITQGSNSLLTSDLGENHVKFLCDSSLHRFCRWLRILGIDTALESEKEHNYRSNGNMMPLFERCRSEGRVLLTTSKALTQRRWCPRSHVISVKNFHESLVELCHEFSLILNPEEFLTKCVKCNGIIQPCEPDDMRLVATKQSIPAGVSPVFLCDGCSQAYWWSESQNSSAVRAKKAADSLYEFVRNRMEHPEESPNIVIDQKAGAEEEEESFPSVNVEVTAAGVGVVRNDCDQEVDNTVSANDAASQGLNANNSHSLNQGNSETLEPNRTPMEDFSQQVGSSIIDPAIYEQPFHEDKAPLFNIHQCEFLPYKSVMSAVSGTEPECTNWNSGFRDVLTSEVIPEGFGNTSWCPDTPPNDLWPSDHALLKCTLRLNL